MKNVLVALGAIFVILIAVFVDFVCIPFALVVIFKFFGVKMTFWIAFLIIVVLKFFFWSITAKKDK